MNDYNGKKMIETARKPYMHSELRKKTLQFLVPISLISFLLSYTCGFSFFFTYNFHFSALIFPLFAHVFDRKYMFLLCNGILAFLAKNLSTYSSSNSPDISGDLAKSTVEDEEQERKGDEQEDLNNLIVREDVEETESLSETAAVEEENEENMSTEELNKKIEEFIRKMKEEIRTEAQQQLITLEPLHSLPPKGRR